MTLGDTEQTTRQRRQLAEAAIDHATHGNWQEAVGANRALLGTALSRSDQVQGAIDRDAV